MGKLRPSITTKLLGIVFLMEEAASCLQGNHRGDSEPVDDGEDAGEQGDAHGPLEQRGTALPGPAGSSSSTRSKPSAGTDTAADASKPFSGIKREWPAIPVRRDSALDSFIVTKQQKKMPWPQTLPARILTALGPEHSNHIRSMPALLWCTMEL
nr:PREDICTED: uncharacterized protein LOC103278075 [Anolis carolinensis]|eukprot:XP_016846331.1 PREDICTED: uncharacterized protein LOC103278075 [Anolis carolinensis]